MGGFSVLQMTSQNLFVLILINHSGVVERFNRWSLHGCLGLCYLNSWSITCCKNKCELYKSQNGLEVKNCVHKLSKLSRLFAICFLKEKPRIFQFEYLEYPNRYQI